jgi:TPR repeat protein
MLRRSAECRRLEFFSTGDDSECYKYSKMSADSGNPYRQRDIGLCFRLDVGVAADSKKAIGYYKLSMDQGRPMDSAPIVFVWIPVLVCHKML